MNLYESIKKYQKLNESTDWEALKRGLGSCRSADDLQDLMHSTMDGSDFGTYCDYVYDINDNSDLQSAKKELKQIADSKIKENTQKGKATNSFKTMASKYFKEFSEFISGLGGSTNYESDDILNYNIQDSFDSLTKSVKDKEEELKELLLSYDSKDTDSYASASGNFIISLNDLDNTFRYNFSLYVPMPLSHYKNYNKNLSEENISINELDKTMTSALKTIKDSITDILNSFDINDYTQWLDKQIELYKNKIQKRTDRKSAKEQAISQDYNSVRLSKQDLINILDKQTNLSQDLFNRKFGSFYVKGNLPDGHKASVTIKLFGGLEPGFFGFEVPETTKNSDFKKHCVDTLVSGLNATAGPDREDHSFGHHGEVVGKTYKVPVSNLTKLPDIIEKLNSELTTTLNIN